MQFVSELGLFIGYLMVLYGWTMFDIKKDYLQNRMKNLRYIRIQVIGIGIMTPCFIWLFWFGKRY